jgi:rhomboid protease GluP
MEKYDEAVSLFKKALEINPDLPEAYYNLAVVYATNASFELAVKYCDKAIELGYKPEQDLLDTLEPYRN